MRALAHANGRKDAATASVKTVRMADHSHLDDAAWFRKRAEEWRALAQQVDAFEDRNNILAIARDYDRFADQLVPRKPAR